MPGECGLGSEAERHVPVLGAQGSGAEAVVDNGKAAEEEEQRPDNVVDEGGRGLGGGAK